MSNEDMEKNIKALFEYQSQVSRDIKALFDHQAQLTTDVSRLESSIEEMKGMMKETFQQAEVERKETRATVGKLTEVITSIAFQADADRAHMDSIENVLRDSIAQANKDRAEMRGFAAEMQSSTEAMNSQMGRFEHQAEIDRQEMKTSISDLTGIMRQLAESQIYTNARVARLEKPPEKPPEQ